MKTLLNFLIYNVYFLLTIYKLKNLKWDYSMILTDLVMKRDKSSN